MWAIGQSAEWNRVLSLLLTLMNSTTSFSMLPPSPKIFHGRDSELNTVVTILLQDSARIAILGTGGMGKTTLALAAVHNAQVESKYSQRYFVSCQSTPTCAELASVIADHLSLEKRPNLLRPVIRYFTHAPPSLLVLDNPLAVSLIASVAGAEGCGCAIARWKCKSTRMLSDGYDQRSSLDISIMLSFTSSRMTPGAQDLLGILSMLPDGFTDADLLQAELAIADILASKATLLRTALAFLDKEKRIQVLAPIREHILHSHPPTNTLKLRLRKHFHDILSLWMRHRDLNVAKIVPQLSRNVANITNVLGDSLVTECPDAIQNYQTILHLNDFYKRTQDTYSPLLLKISEQKSFWSNNPILGNYLIQIVETARYVPLPDADTTIMLGNKYFEFKDPLEQGKTCFVCCVALASFLVSKMVYGTWRILEARAIRHGWWS
jgi:RecA/RadA recombinase